MKSHRKGRRFKKILWSFRHLLGIHHFLFSTQYGDLSISIMVLLAMLGWGIAIAIHSLKVFGFSDEWEKRKIQEILDKENQPPTSKWK